MFTKNVDIFCSKFLFCSNNYEFGNLIIGFYGCSFAVSSVIFPCCLIASSYWLAIFSSKVRLVSYNPWIINNNALNFCYFY